MIAIEVKSGYNQIMYKGELFNSITHLVGTVLALIGAIILVVIVSQRGDVWQIVSFSIFGISWGLALLGIINDCINLKLKRKWQSIAIYVAMGWLIVIALRPLLQVLPLKGFILLLMGGIFYTAGIAFYIYDEKRPYFHGIWHLFVLAGSVFHYITIVGFLI